MDYQKCECSVFSHGGLKAADHHAKIFHPLKVLLLLGGASIWQFTVFMQVTLNGFILKHVDGLLLPAALGSNCGITWVGRSDVQTAPTGPVLMRSCSLDALTAQPDHGAVFFSEVMLYS